MNKSTDIYVSYKEEGESGNRKKSWDVSLSRVPAIALIVIFLVVIGVGGAFIII